MKKFLALILIVIMAIGVCGIFTACNPNKDGDTITVKEAKALGFKHVKAE